MRFAGIQNKIADSLSVKKISLFHLLGTKKLSYTSGCTNSFASFNDIFSAKISHCFNNFAYLLFQSMINQTWTKSWAKLGMNLDSFVCSIVQVFAHIFFNRNKKLGISLNGITFCFEYHCFPFLHQKKYVIHHQL